MIDDRDPGLEQALRSRADALDVPWVPLRRSRPKANRVTVFASLAAVLVLAVIAGGALGARRQSAVGTPGPGAAPPQVDARYGWLAFADADRAGDLRLYDETGAARSAAIAVAGGAVVSPNGRYVAVWSEPGRGASSTLRFVDAASGTIGPVVFATDEVLSGKALAGNGAIAWASDSSAVVLATTPFVRLRPVDESVHHTIRTVDLSGAVRVLGASDAPSVDPVGWDRVADRVAFKVGVNAPGKNGYWVFQPNGPALGPALTVDDVPIGTDSASRYVVSYRACAGCPPTFVVHDFVTYDIVKEIPVAAAGASGDWSAQFRPGSSDLIVRTDTGVRTDMTFKVTLYPDAGRGTPRVIDTLHIEDPAGVVSAPVFQVRADGSALFFGIRNHDGTAIGHLIDLATGATTNLAQRPVIAQAIASVVISSGIIETRPPVQPPASIAALFDRTPEFPGYPWTRDGKPMDSRELSTIAGPAHCSWQTATMLQIGWPPGTVAQSGAQLRMYIRDPRGVMRGDFQQRLVLGARLPSDARPTGYRYGGAEIYLSPSDQDEAIYLVGPDGAERWPRSDPLTLCS